MDNKRDQWGSKLGFILAAIGSAVGLGNIWRFPYLVYENGGGAFLVPYFFAIFTAGIPLLILEYGMGHKFRGSTPLALARANKKWEWLGWWPSITAFFILGYYSMILSWAMKYFTLSFNKGWGNDTNAYFYNDFLRLTDSPFQFGSVIWPVLIGILLVWGISWFICYRGVKGGIEKLNKILLPTLVAIMVIIAIRGVTLEGATLGLNKLFTPDWSKVMEPKVWIAAYGQVFYSLSLAMGIMMTYSSYLPKKTDINNSAFMTGFANCGFEFLCAIAVFAILGVMATSQGVGIEEVVSSGIGLAFIVFPKVFTVMGTWGTILGCLFFACLVFAGLTSCVSLVEAVSSAIIDKTGWERKKVVSYISIIGALLSATFATGAGLYILDIMDNFINCYGIVVVGLLEANKTLGSFNKVFAGLNGIEGILNGNIIELSSISQEEINNFKYTPSSGLGSCRYKMKKLEESTEEYDKLLEILKANDIKLECEKWTRKIEELKKVLTEVKCLCKKNWNRC